MDSVDVTASSREGMLDSGEWLSSWYCWSRDSSAALDRRDDGAAHGRDDVTVMSVRVLHGLLSSMLLHQDQHSY